MLADDYAALFEQAAQGLRLCGGDNDLPGMSPKATRDASAWRRELPRMAATGEADWTPA